MTEVLVVIDIQENYLCENGPLIEGMHIMMRQIENADSFRDSCQCLRRGVKRCHRWQEGEVNGYWFGLGPEKSLPADIPSETWEYIESCFIRCFIDHWKGKPEAEGVVMREESLREALKTDHPSLGFESPRPPIDERRLAEWIGEGLSAHSRAMRQSYYFDGALRLLLRGLETCDRWKRGGGNNDWFGALGVGDHISPSTLKGIRTKLMQDFLGHWGEALGEEPITMERLKIELSQERPFGINRQEPSIRRAVKDFGIKVVRALGSFQVLPFQGVPSYRLPE